ncbi:hypothetical protein ODY93_09615 [Shewanella xiamenensis]|uniref:Uncharacterized protein n=1 Tax=Shewanella xiamenensis TaxID=332186 RepID=A0ABT6UDH9_9GAMM|nr:hypothetical protein [Shewanella xiamenensis]
MAINKDKLSADIEARMDEFAQELALALAEYYDWWLSHYPAQTPSTVFAYTARP